MINDKFKSKKVLSYDTDNINDIKNSEKNTGLSFSYKINETLINDTLNSFLRAVDPSWRANAVRYIG